MLFLVGTFRFSSVVLDFRFFVEIGNERGIFRLFFRFGFFAFIDFVRFGLFERFLVCFGESLLKIECYFMLIFILKGFIFMYNFESKF